MTKLDSKNFIQRIKNFISKITEKNLESLRKSLRNCPNSCQRVSKAQCKKAAKCQTAGSISRFLCPGTLLYFSISQSFWQRFSSTTIFISNMKKETLLHSNLSNLLYPLCVRGGGLGSRPKRMYGERLGDGVEYHLMSPTPRR